MKELSKQLEEKQLEEKQFNLIKKLTELNGVPGREENVRDFILGELKEYLEEVKFDGLGSIICKRKNISKKIPKYKVAIVSHMDEVGFLVKSIEKNGTLRIHSLGSISPLVAFNSQVEVETRTKQIFKGIILSDTAQLKDITMENLYVDIGLSSEEDVKLLKITEGNSITFNTQTIKLENTNQILGKAFDDRLGCSLGIELFKKIKNKKLDLDLYFIGSVQEEIGTRGGKTSLEIVNPDIVIVLDVATAKDSMGIKNKSRYIGKGPCIVLCDKYSVGNRELINLISDVAEENNIPYQFDILSGGGTDNAPASLNNGGTISTSIIIPIKNCHSPYSMVDLSDYAHTLQLLEKIILKLNIENLKNLKDKLIIL